MTIIGSAYVDIRAITDSLEADIKKALATLPDRIDVSVHADTLEAEKQIDLLVEWGNIHIIDVNVNANTAGAQAHVDAAVATMSHEEVDINVNADTVGAAAHVDAFVHEESGRDINVPVDVDEAAAITKMAALKAKLEAIAGLKPITIPVAVGNGKGPIGDIENALRATSAELDKANLKLTGFGSALQGVGEHAKTSGANVGEFLLKLSGMQGLTDLTKKLIELKISLGEEVPKIAMVAEKIGTMATGASYAVGNILSLASGIAQLGGVALALPGIFTGFAIGMGITTTAFGDMKKAVPELAKEMQDLKNLITQDFWSQARSGFQSLIGPTSVLREELVSTSKTVGAFWGTMFDGASKGTFATAMAGDFENLRKSIEITTNGSSVFLHVIEQLGVIGSALLPRLADYFVSITTQFDGFLTKASTDGSLNRWVENGISAMKDLIGIVTNTIGVLGGLMQAANEAGGTSLHTLNAALEHLREIILTPGVQTALINIFSGANDAMKSAADGVSNFLKGVGYLSPALKVVEQDVGRAIDTVLTFFGAILTNPTLFKGIQDLFGGILLGLDHFVTALTPIGDKIGIFFSLVGTVADSLGNVFASAITIVLPLVAQLLAGIIPIVKPLGDITVAVVTALAPALGILVSTAFPPLINLLVTSVLPALDKLVPALGIALPPMAAALGDAIQKLAPIIGDLITHITPIIEKLIEIASKAIPDVLNVLPGLVDGFVGLLKAIEPILNPILDLINHFLDTKGAGDIIVGALALVIGTIITFNATIGLVKGVIAGFELATAAVAVVNEIMGTSFTVAGAAAAIFGGILEATPIGLIVLGVAALVAGIVLLIANWDAVSKAVTNFANDAGKNLTDFFNSTGSMITDFNNNTNGMFKDFANNTGGMFKDFFNNTGGMFKDFFNKTGQDVGNFNKDTDGMFKDFANNTGGMFKDFFNNTVGMVTDWGKRTVGMFVDFFNNTVGMFTDFFNKVMEGFRGFAHDPIGEVHKFVDGIINAVKSFGMDILINITKAFNDVKNAISKWATEAIVNVAKFFVDTVTGFNNWRNDIINTVVRWAMDIAIHIGQFELNVRDIIVRFVINTVGMFKDFFNNTMGMFTDFWNNLPNIVNTFVSNTTGMIADFNRNTNGMFMDFFANTGGMFVDFFNNTVGMFVDFFNNTVGMIGDFNKNTNGMFMDFFANTGGMFVDFFNNTVGMFVDFVNNCINSINGWVAGLMGMFIDFYAQTTGETRAFLDGFISSVGGWVNNTVGMFRDFWNNTIGMFTDMWANMGRAVDNGIAGLLAWFIGMGQRILGAIGNPGDLLAHAGQAIMDGFLGGLQAGFKGVQDMVGGIGQWIADHKGPEEYDRALLIPHGGWIMGGLQKGIEGSMGGLKNTLSGVTDLISDTMNASVSVNVGSGLSGGAQSNPNIFSNPAARNITDPFAALSSMQQGRYGAGTVITPTVNVYPSAPLNEAQVGQMAAQELYWNFISR